jgi:hypothetical protein
MPTLDFVGTTQFVGNTRAHRGLAVVQLHDELWRVTLPEGDVLGYVEGFRVTGGLRYRVKRLLARQRRFMVDGEFWSMDDALECFRSL